MSKLAYIITMVGFGVMGTVLFILGRYTESPSAIAASGNPLLMATHEQFARWYPGFCAGQIDGQSRQMNNCVAQVRANVKSETGVDITREQVLDPAVKIHMRDVDRCRCVLIP